ncbi:MAG: Retroviral aspartyl protease [bacterium]|nr:Retroviral aspartyl protease [bacterium]MDE0353495.1 Retroviral aspartyl protease [bacterium]
MGVLNQTVRLAAEDGGRSLDVELMVDIGTLFTMVPAPLLRELGVSPIDRFPLVLQDGRRVEYDMGRAIATVEGRSIHTLVLFGEKKDRPRLGTYTLDGLRLAVDPVRGKLVPATGFLVPATEFRALRVAAA